MPGITRSRWNSPWKNRFGPHPDEGDGGIFRSDLGRGAFFKEDIFEIFRKHSDMAFLVFTHGGLIDEAWWSG